jgi:integrase
MKLTEGRQIGPEHAKRQRRLLDRFILTDAIADLPLRAIRKGHVMDFRTRVLGKCGADVSDEENSKGKRTASLALAALSAIFSLAVSREELESNPVARITVRSKGTPRGTLTLAELRRLFPYSTAELGPWRDQQAKCAFLLAGTCGLRRNEVRALRWGRVDLAGAKLKVDESFKGNVRRAKPKWNKQREMALPHVAAVHLKALGPGEGLVFHHADGSPLGVQWWEGAFTYAMVALKIDAKARRIVPHSLRHSLASELRVQGVSDALLRSTFGWQDDVTTDRYAGHQSAEHGREPAKVIDFLLAGRKKTAG